MFVFLAIIVFLPATIAIGVFMLWLTSKRRYLALVFLAALIEYVFWLSNSLTTFKMPGSEASIWDSAFLPTLAFVCVMIFSWYVMSRSKVRVRA